LKEVLRYQLQEVLVSAFPFILHSLLLKGRFK